MKTCIRNLFLLPAMIAGLSFILVERVAAQTFTTLHSFTAFSGYYSNSDGVIPSGELTLSGNTLFGTASYGGSSGNGTVFAVNTDGTGFTILHTFTAAPDPDYANSDGVNPSGGLTLSGNTLYGTAPFGGRSSGTVFALNTDGTGFTALHSFTLIPDEFSTSDGANPYCGLILSGNTLYGTTYSEGGSFAGTVFKVNTNGTGFTSLYSFTAFSASPPYVNSDGGLPYAGLVLSGNTLYGTAQAGGSSGNGTVFAVNTDGTGFTSLHSFTAFSGPFSTNSDGARPFGRLVLSGNTLYGTAPAGGSSGVGTVFAVNTDGTGFTTLHGFTGGSGAGPLDGLILSGNTLYGAAGGGGSSGSGTLFAVHTDGTGFTTLHSFTAFSGPFSTNSGGAWPFGRLVLSGNTLYGTARFGGSSGSGTVFSLEICSLENNTNAIARPVPFLVSKTVNEGNGWKINGFVSDDDGLVLTNISLGRRFLAEKFSLPYCTIKTTAITNRFELVPNGESASCRSKLVSFSRTNAHPSWPDAYVIEAVYNIDRIGASHMVVTQQYVFKFSLEKAEPSGTFQAKRFFPMVKYAFCGEEGEQLIEFSTAQRLHFQVDGIPTNSAAIIKDELSADFHPITTPLLGDPLPFEYIFQALTNGAGAASDNYHQTWADAIDEPAGPNSLGVFSAAGCPECAHIHWRWLGSTLFAEPFTGKPLIPRRDSNPPFDYDSHQSVDVGIFRFEPTEDDPIDFHSLLDTNINPNITLPGQSPVIWYVARSPEVRDQFFIHGGFFSPDISVLVDFKTVTVNSVRIPVEVWVKAPPGTDISIEYTPNLTTWIEQTQLTTVQVVTKIPINFSPQSGLTAFRVRVNGLLFEP